MKILKVRGTNLFDIFTNLGWGNHTRILANKVGHIIHVNGKVLQKIQLIEISKTILNGLPKTFNPRTKK